MDKGYKYAIVYFLLFGLLLFASAVVLFEHKIGFSKLEVLHYYLGDEASFMIAKSPLGILKIILPHIFAFGVFMMVMLHFLIFTKYRDTKQLTFIIYASYISASAELLSPFMILYGFEFFAYVKLLSFFALFALQLYISCLLFISIIKE